MTSPDAVNYGGPVSFSPQDIAFSPDGSTLASAVGNDQVALWNVTDPARAYQMATLGGTGDFIQAFTFSPRGDLLAAVTFHGTVLVYSLADPGRPVRTATVRGLLARARYPDGRSQPHVALCTTCSPASYAVAFAPGGHALTVVVNRAEMSASSGRDCRAGRAVLAQPVPAGAGLRSARSRAHSVVSSWRRAEGPRPARSSRFRRPGIPWNRPARRFQCCFSVVPARLLSLAARPGAATGRAPADKDKDGWHMRHRFTKLAGALAAVTLAAGFTMAGTGIARAAVTPPVGTWAEIFAPEINSNGITLCADNFGSNAQFHNLQLWRCHGYASNGTPQRWVFTYVGQYLGIGAPEYRISNAGSGYCIGLDPNSVNIPRDQIAGTNLVQEDCNSILTIWEMVPATLSPDPNNQFMLVNVWGPLTRVPFAMEANTFLDQNGNRLIAEPEDFGNSAQWFALG